MVLAATSTAAPRAEPNEPEWKRLKVALDALQLEVVAQKKEMENQEQEIADLKVVLPSRYIRNTTLSSVKILGEDGSSVGVGFFVTPTKVVTALHCIEKFSNFGLGMEIRGMRHNGVDFNLDEISLVLDDYNRSLDVAVLVSSSSNECYLKIGQLSPSSEDPLPLDFQTKCLAITSFCIGLSGQLHEFSPERFHVATAVLLRTSAKHFLYSSSLFSGDSGGAIIHTTEGTVVGMHLETVNESLELMSYNVEEIKDSINSLVNGAQSGYVGVILNIREILEMVDGRTSQAKLKSGVV